MNNENKAQQISDAHMATLRWWAFYALLSNGPHVDEEQIEEKAREMWDEMCRHRGLGSSRRN